MSDITVDVLDQIQAVDIEEYQEYLKAYDSAEDNRLQTKTGERGLKRKLSALRSFYTYYYKNGTYQDESDVSRGYAEASRKRNHPP